MLDNPMFFEFMRDRVLPRLLEHMQYDEAIDYCNSISAFCAKANDTANALVFKSIATDVYEKYISDRVEEGV